MKKFLLENKKNPWFWAFVAMAFVLLFAMPLMSTSAGNSGDEDSFQIPQGRNVLNYYKTDGQDTTCFSFENLKYYGCSFDVVTAWFNETFGIDDIATSRHIFNSLCGWLIILFGGLIAWRIGGWRAGVFTMALLFLSPRLLGHSFNNPKDIPFAAGVTMSLYYMIMFFRQAPKPKWITMVMLALSIAFAISIRVGGLIIFGYFGLFGLLWLIKNVRMNKKQSSQKGNKKLQPAVSGSGIWRTIGWAVVICMVGFFAGLLLWPYAWQSPIANVSESYSAMSKFAIGIRQVFEGQMLWSGDLPWYYTPKFILMTIPVAVIAGFLLYPFFGGFRKENWLETTMVYFTFVFPVFWIVYTGANVYGGWRHSLFAYPTMAVAAGLGFSALADFVRNKVGHVACCVLPFVLLVPPFMHIVRNHPYEYIYFNEFEGGIKNAFGNYELDYYYHSIREATEWVVANAQPAGNSEKIKVGSWHINSTKYFLRNDTNRFEARFVRWYEQGETDWDYAVFAITGISPEYLKNPEVFPPKNTVHTVDVDGVPVAVVLKRKDKNDFIGTQLKKENKLDSAKFHYFKALEADEHNMTAITNLAEIYLRENKPDSCIAIASRFTAFEPHNNQANYFIAYAYYAKNDFQRTISLCEDIIAHNVKYSAAYMLLRDTYLRIGDLFSAENTMVRMMDLDMVDNEFVGMWIKINKAEGFDERMAYVKLFKALVESSRKRGLTEDAEKYQQQLDQLQ